MRSLVSRAFAEAIGRWPISFSDKAFDMKHIARNISIASAAIVLTLGSVAVAQTSTNQQPSSQNQSATSNQVSKPTVTTTPGKSPVQPKTQAQAYCLDRSYRAEMPEQLGNRFADGNLSTDDQYQAIALTNIGELTRLGRVGNDSIALESYLLPVGDTVNIGLTNTFKPNDVYYGHIIFIVGQTKDRNGQDVDLYKYVEFPSARTHAATSDDGLVKSNKLAAGSTIVSLNIPDVDWSSSWGKARLYIFKCNASPLNIAQTDVRVSPSSWSAWLAGGIALIAYLVAALVLGGVSPLRQPLAFINPVRFTAGVDGRASLGKMQVLGFSLLVFGLISYLVLRTGLLVELSSTILTLLGIAGVGATLAKGADLQRTTLTPDNRAFLVRKQWLTSPDINHGNKPKWNDLLTTGKEFDVYRFQSLIFSVAVGAALFIGGVTQLSSFTIPQTLLGILGLSQAVYIGGKIVTPTNMVTLNATLDDLRALELKFQDAVKAANGGIVPQALTPQLQTAVQSTYDAYRKQATSVRGLFESETNILVDPAKIEPSL